MIPEEQAVRLCVSACGAAGAGCRPPREPLLGHQADASSTTGRHAASPAQPARRPLPAVPGRNSVVPPAGQAGMRIPPFTARQGCSADGGWPLQDFLELGALAGAVPCARLHSREVLREWGMVALARAPGFWLPS
jgi:hypothetical protein